jgi:diguanylate cyclase (GGDEF)-like protein
MQPGEILEFLQHVGRDPSRLIFEDELTGVHNRRFLHSYLEHKVHWTSGTEYPLSVLILDLDRFKDINDTLGHATGDQVLTWVAAVLRDVAADQGLPVRFGGDEFILLLPRTDQVGARDVATRLLQRVRDRPFRLRDAGIVVPVTLSIGVATAPADGTPPASNEKPARGDPGGLLGCRGQRAYCLGLKLPCVSMTNLP